MFSRSFASLRPRNLRLQSYARHAPSSALSLPSSTGLAPYGSTKASLPVASSSSAIRKNQPFAALKAKIPVKEDHGLWNFFRKVQSKSGAVHYEILEVPEDVTKLSGRPWKASELRLKSFKDLHILWYVVIRERNLLATAREETRRLGLSVPATLRDRQCRKTMARIKYVINERRLAYEGAVKLHASQKIAAKNQKEDMLVFKHQLRAWSQKRSEMSQRLELRAQRMRARRKIAERAATIAKAHQEASEIENADGERKREVKLNAKRKEKVLEREIKRERLAVEKVKQERERVQKEIQKKSAEAEEKKRRTPAQVNLASAGLFGESGPPKDSRLN